MSLTRIAGEECGPASRCPVKPRPGHQNLAQPLQAGKLEPGPGLNIL
jgi:hypothetical protein